MSGDREQVRFRGFQGAVRAGKNLPAPRSFLSTYNMNNFVKNFWKRSLELFMTYEKFEFTEVFRKI